VRRRIVVEVDGSIFVLRGWQAHRLAVEAGLRPTYSGIRQGWMADTSRLADLEAYCSRRQVPLTVRGADLERAAADRGIDRGDDRLDDAEPTLFDLDLDR
jgi:hypothetical protein